MTGYLGPSGTFSHMAALKFLKGKELLEYPTIYSALCAVDTGIINACIVPIENSLEGSVTATLDTLFFDTSLYITSEHILRIHQNLLTLPGRKKEDIKTILSHPQAIGQCARMLNSEFEGVQIKFCDSTAIAAKTVAEGDGSSACIASLESARKESLEVLIADCGDERSNSTRFVVLEKKRSKEVFGNDKTSIAFTLKNRYGALYKAISVFEKYKINMIKIESRPQKTKPGEYVFFIDIDGNIDDVNIYFALEELKKMTMKYKFLGSYEKKGELLK